MLEKGTIPHTVAPFTGAWIETILSPVVADVGNGRTLHGCVD